MLGRERGACRAPFGRMSGGWVQRGQVVGGGAHDAQSASWHLGGGACAPGVGAGKPELVGFSATGGFAPSCEWQAEARHAGRGRGSRCDASIRGCPLGTCCAGAPGRAGFHPPAPRVSPAPRPTRQPWRLWGSCQAGGPHMVALGPCALCSLSQQGGCRDGLAERRASCTLRGAPVLKAEPTPASSDGPSVCRGPGC